MRVINPIVWVSVLVLLSTPSVLSAPVALEHVVEFLMRVNTPGAPPLASSTPSSPGTALCVQDAAVLSPFIPCTTLVDHELALATEVALAASASTASFADPGAAVAAPQDVAAFNLQHMGAVPGIRRMSGRVEELEEGLERHTCHVWDTKED